MKRGPYKGSFLWKLQELPEERVLEVVKISVSIHEACEKLSLTLNGSAYPAFKTYLDERGISSDHFLGKAVGIRHKGGIVRKTPDQRLVLQNKKQGTTDLKDYLLEIGRDYVCSCCGIGPVWQGKELRIETDHINGNRLDDRRENLRFLCPNCHSQTSTFRNKKRTPG